MPEVVIQSKSDYRFSLVSYADAVDGIANAALARRFDFSKELKEVVAISSSLPNNPEDDISQFTLFYATIQNSLSRITVILLDMLFERGEWKALSRSLKTVYDRSKRMLYATREDIQKLKNQQLQEAAVQNEISELVSLGELIASAMDELDTGIEIATLKKADLESANVNLNRQQRAIESMISLGLIQPKDGIYGTKR